MNKTDSATDFVLAAPTEVGTLGVYHLKRLWSRTMSRRQSMALGPNREADLENLLIHTLGLGLEQTRQYLGRVAPSFEEFEQWIIATTGGVEASRIARFNALITNAECPPETRRYLDEIEAAAPVLSAADLAFWEENGYVILHDAVSEESRCAAEQAIWEHLSMSADDPESWYKQRNNGIMVQLFQHPAFEANRRSPRIHKAFAELWGTADLWATTDRVGFNVPERPGWPFPGPHLHWDVSLYQPIPFGTQGILYLTDTEAEQGAFTCVPGFQHRVGAWLDSLPADANPRQEDLHALGSKPIAGRAGDLVIWHQALPHGSRPNRATRPRIVQYINMEPALPEKQEIWV